MVKILSRIEPDSHRKALNYLDVVAGCIFRRQETVQLAACAGQPLDESLILLAGCIDMNCHRLASVHLAYLRLTEVRRNPDIAEWNDREHFLTWLQSLPKFYGFFADY